MSITASPEYKERFYIRNPELETVTKQVSPAQKSCGLRLQAIEDHYERLRLKAEAKEVWE